MPAGAYCFGCLEGDIDIARAQHLIERAVLETIRLRWIKRLVHHIPRIDLGAKMLHLALDVFLNVGGHVLGWRAN